MDHIRLVAINIIAEQEKEPASSFSGMINNGPVFVPGGSCWFSVEVEHRISRVRWTVKVNVDVAFVNPRAG